MNYQEVEEFLFRDTVFFKESLNYLQTLEDTTYFKMVFLIEEGFSFQYTINKLKINKQYLYELFFILQSFWGYKFQDKELLKRRNMNCLKTIKISLPENYYWRF